MKVRDFFKIIIEKKDKLFIFFVGVIINSVVFNYLYDYLLYPFVIWKLGVVKGGVIMIILSTLICYLLLVFYDWSKKDWLGIESIKQVREYGGSSKIGRIASWILKRGNVAVMILLSLQFDPFITTAYMRLGSGQYNGLSKRDWKIFFTSTFIANVFWIIVSYGGVSLIKYIWQGA